MGQLERGFILCSCLLKYLDDTADIRAMFITLIYSANLVVFCLCSIMLEIRAFYNWS